MRDVGDGWSCGMRIKVSQNEEPVLRGSADTLRRCRYLLLEEILPSRRDSLVEMLRGEPFSFTHILHEGEAFAGNKNLSIFLAKLLS